MDTPGIPQSIPRAQMLAGIRSMGIDPTHVQSMTWSVDEVTVHRYRLDENGKHMMVGDDPVMESFVIAVVEGQ